MAILSVRKFNNKVFRITAIFITLILLTTKVSANTLIKEGKWFLFPIGGNTSETGLQLGFVSFYLFKTKAKKSSIIDLNFYRTVKKQTHLKISNELFLNNDKYRIYNKLELDDWVSNFYELGNNSLEIEETYKNIDFNYELSVQRYYKNFTIGCIYRYTNESIDADNNGKLINSDLFGKFGGIYSGLGFSIGYDSRDNINAPHTGNYSSYEYIKYSKKLSSLYNFNTAKLFIRQYIPTSMNSTFAIGTLFETSCGDVPFRKLPTPDGLFMLRGILKRRYIDKNMLGLQTEYRFPITGKFLGTVFCELARVYPDLNNITFNDFKSSIGIGLRYNLNDKHKFNLRLDLSWVDDGIGFVIYTREAF